MNTLESQTVTNTINEEPQAVYLWFIENVEFEHLVRYRFSRKSKSANLIIEDVLTGRLVELSPDQADKLLDRLKSEQKKIARSIGLCCATLEKLF